MPASHTTAPAVGSRVRLVTPENPRLHGQPAVVVGVEEWGCHCECAAAATGRFRASWDEMESERKQEGPKATEMGYVGEACSTCQSMTLRRNGSCLVCDSCGSTSGCS